MQRTSRIFKFFFVALGCALLVTQGGCVKRNLEFNCNYVLPTDSVDAVARAVSEKKGPAAAAGSIEPGASGPSEAEMEMSPTKLQFKGVAYRFQEEAGAWRTYEAGESKSRLQFNPVSGELLLGDEAWSCRRYEALLEKAKQ
jgi:hypothetical protein